MAARRRVQLDPFQLLVGHGDRDRKPRALIPVELAPRVVDLCLAGADPRNPYASPLYGDPRGLPPTLLQVGSDEILRDDAVRMAERMREAGCEATLAIWPRMPPQSFGRGVRSSN